MATSPTQRSLAYCRKQGWEAGIVEKWIPQTNRRQDLFGFADLIVLKPPSQTMEQVAPWTGVFSWTNGTILAVQTTSGSNAAARVAKIKAEPRAKAWLDCGGLIEVWAWRKVKVKRGGKAVRWELRVVPVVDVEDPDE